MEELIKIKEENGKRAVNARDLHQFLESKRDFSNWIKDRIEKYDFQEDVDYQKLYFDYKGNLLTISHNKNIESDYQRVSKIEYALSIEMAKELSMVENNEKGRKARRYFIECEKKLARKEELDMPKTYLEALKALVVAEEAKEKLKLENTKLVENNKHQAQVIEGLVYDIPVADMRQRINQIVNKECYGDFGGSWRMLYEEFDRKYHMNIRLRISNSGYKGSCMDYIDHELGMIAELYDLACKLFESSYEQLMESWGKYAKRAKKYKSQA